MDSQRDPLQPPVTTTTVATVGDGITTKEPAVPKSLHKEFDDGENDEDEDDNESWFELELTFPKQTSTKLVTVSSRADTDSDLGCSKRRASTTSTSSDDSNSTTTSSIFYRDHIIRRMESPDVRLSSDNSPPSPISILRTPTLRRLMYGAEKRSHSHASQFAPTPTPSWSRRGVRFFSVRFRIEDVSKFRRSNSSSSRVSIPEKRSVDDASPPSSTRQFSRYFNFLKPLYFRVSEKEKSREEFGGGAPSATGIGSPARRGWMWSPMRGAAAKERRNGSRFGGTARRLGKSRSTSEVVGVGSAPMSRKDDSMKQLKDGIEGAIQHCKQSLNSTSGRTCSLSRCTSDTYGKSFQRL